MYNRILNLLRKEFEKERNLEKRYRARLSKLEEYNKVALKNTRSKGINYYSKRNPDGTWQYLGSESNPEVRAIKEAKQLGMAIEQIEKNRKAFIAFTTKFKPVMLGKFKVPTVYQLEGTGEHSLDAITWKKKQEEIKESQGEYMPEGLVHTTNDGTKVRSKSEVIIYNLMLELGLVFVYEMPMKIGGRIVRPDFTIYNETDGEIYILEHLGMIGDERYMEMLARKLEEYDKAGFSIGGKLLLTSDNLQGQINSKMIERMLSNVFL